MNKVETVDLFRESDGRWWATDIILNGVLVDSLMESDWGRLEDIVQVAKKAPSAEDFHFWFVQNVRHFHTEPDGSQWHKNSAGGWDRDIL